MLKTSSSKNPCTYTLKRVVKHFNDIALKLSVEQMKMTHVCYFPK